MKRVLLLVSLYACLTGSALGTTLTANMTADDEFSLYLSTDDSQIGTLIGSGSDWATTYTLTADLTPGVTNYIHVVAADTYQYIAGFLGDFTISDASFKFANGTQNLLTGAEYWSISDSGFAVGYYAPSVLGTNGDFPWGPLSGISPSASWIWSDQGLDFSTRYFSAEIIPR